MAMHLVLAEAQTHVAPQPVAAPASTSSSNADWAFSGSVFAYFPPGTDPYLQPTVTADHGWLHLEARYNSEALDTGSLWVGYNLSGGDHLKWEFTPMFGGVFGDLNGVSPGYEAGLDWWKLELELQGEYVFDVGDSFGSYFYNWGELRFWPIKHARVGFAAQRTHVYETSRDVQPGFLVGFTWKQLDVAGYVFDPDTSDPTWVAAVTFDF